MMTEPGGGESISNANVQAIEEHRKIRELTERLGHAPSLVELLRRLQELRSFMAPHFTDEEAPGGFFDVVRTQASRHLGTVQQLETEHAALLGELDRLAEGARACLVGPVAEILKQAREFARRLHEHEARENELLIDALYVDVGGGD
jgi:hypothetical protein